MKLVRARVGPFKSINSPQDVAIDDKVTVLVGMNEAGKTIFLQALEKSEDALRVAEFDPVDDYPRKDLSAYLKRHKDEAELVTSLTYRLEDSEVTEINAELGTKVQKGFEFSVNHSYSNATTIVISVEEKPIIQSLLGRLSAGSKAKIKGVDSLRQIPEKLKGASLTDEDKAFLEEINKRISETKWQNVGAAEAWTWLSQRLPKFLYFSDYDMLPSKINLTDLARRVAQAKTDSKQLQPKHRAVLALLRMADISIEEFTKTGGYEPLKAKIEAVSISLTDQIMEFWKQNEDLEIEVDIKSDPEDEAPFNQGVNLYLRIRNRRHRGVSTPFAQRSRGFIWFFSFLVWFDSVQHQIDSSSKIAQHPLILLLDEPGLALHALAQADFLKYIDQLSTKHQVLYTTHSPFMVHSNRLQDVRVVEDKLKEGTVISSDVGSSDPRTIFPLQAALGWTIAQNLFISERNLLVEGPGDLIYLKAMSSIIEANGKAGLRDDITVVPVGGLDKLTTFIALLGASGLKLAVFHDYRGAPEQKLGDLVKQKLIPPKMLLNAAQFRDLSKLGTASQASDTEDLFDVEWYLDEFNAAYAKELGKKSLKVTDLEPGDRIVDRIERTLEVKKIQVRPSSGFNHYRVASHFATNPPTSLKADVLARFAALFKAVNGLI